MTTPISNGEAGSSVRTKLNAIIAKVDGISDNATVDQTGAAIKTAYESEADTNAFTDTEKANLADQSGTNTGDQDLSNFQVQPSEGAFVNGDKTRLDAAVQSTTISSIVSLTQAAYDALTPASTTFYVITD
jgi:hypothetical protein